MHDILQEIQEKGYLIIRNFFQETELSRCWKAIDSLAKAFAIGLGIDSNKFDEVLPTERDRMLVSILQKRPDLQSVLYNRLQMVPELLALPSNKVFQDLAKQLLKTDSIGVWPRLQVRLDLFNDDKNVIGWHHDYLYNKGTSASYTFWMPLVSTRKEMGTLLLADGSHKLEMDGMFKPVEGDRRFAFNLEPEVLERLSYWEPEGFSAGDLVVFHRKLVHSGMLNQVHDRARLTVLFRMQNLETLEAF